MTDDEAHALAAAYDATVQQLDRAIRAASGAVSAIEAVHRRLLTAAKLSTLDHFGGVWISKRKRATMDDAVRAGRTAQRALDDLAAVLPKGAGVVRRLPNLTVEGRNWDVWIGGWFIDRWVVERITALCDHVALVLDHTCELEYSLKKRRDKVAANRSAISQDL